MIVAAISSARAARPSCSAARWSARSARLSPDQPANAARASRTARSTSAAVASATWATMVSVAGFSTSMSPPAAGRHPGTPGVDAVVLRHGALRSLRVWRSLTTTVSLLATTVRQASTAVSFDPHRTVDRAATVVVGRSRARHHGLQGRGSRRPRDARLWPGSVHCGAAVGWRNGAPAHRARPGRRRPLPDRPDPTVYCTRGASFATLAERNCRRCSEWVRIGGGHGAGGIGRGRHRRRRRHRPGAGERFAAEGARAVVVADVDGDAAARGRRRPAARRGPRLRARRDRRGRRRRARAAGRGRDRADRPVVLQRRRRHGRGPGRRRRLGPRLAHPRAGPRLRRPPRAARAWSSAGAATSWSPRRRPAC